MTSSQYERELRSILEGQVKILEKITKTCSVMEKMNYFKIAEKPFAVVRAAGSFGCDLIAARGNISFLTEVKTSTNNTLHFSSMSGKLQEQAETMIHLCEKTKNLPIYAFRTKNKHGENWRIFTLDVDGLEGNLSILHKRIPKIEKSNSGNYVMRWENGMALSDFISYLCR
jgi:Holliday junction resolvase